MQEQPDEAARAASFAAWTGWFESMGSSVVEKGNPVSGQTTVGQAADTRVGGYSLIEAPDAAAAAALAKGCPTVQLGGRRRGDRRGHGRAHRPGQRSRGGAGGRCSLSGVRRRRFPDTAGAGLIPEQAMREAGIS
jgi:hypothetical protein